MGADILFCGDPHGRFDQINRVARELRPAAIILLGDYDLERPLEQVLGEALELTEIGWIPGNHDYDSEQAYDNLFASALADHNLHGRVREFAGVRVAGLGGVFQGTVWYPQTADCVARFHTRSEFLRTCGRGNIWRGGLPRKRRGAIWPEDVEALRTQQTDVLVTHEAPACHPNGFAAIEELALAMGAHTIVHGHHHTPYTVRYRSGRLTVHGVGLAGVARLDGEQVVPGRNALRQAETFWRRRTRSQRIFPDQLP